MTGFLPRPHTGWRDRSSAVDANRIPVPVTRATVDCGVYVDRQRLPGNYTHTAALQKVHELGDGFVWLGLHEPDEQQMQAVATVFGLHLSQLTSLAVILTWRYRWKPTSTAWRPRSLVPKAMSRSSRFTYSSVRSSSCAER